ncbi:MAG: hypothetical protein GWP39_05695 [Planctomycetia bacterium]|nr:hypothetical protein [Planctomycetia bacterium]NCG56095.1 hypothetical protein [Pseudomonadota bacterium]
MIGLICRVAMMMTLTSIPVMAIEHVPGPLNVETKVTESETEVYLLIDELLFRHWFNLDPTIIPELEPDSSGRWGEFGDKIVRWLDLHASLDVDGVQVTPMIEDLEWQEGFDLNDFLNYVGITLKYPTKTMPSELEFVWSRFDTEDGFPLESVFMILTGADDFQILRFREDDPIQAWSPPEARPVLDPETVKPGLVPPMATVNLFWVTWLMGLVMLFKTKKFTPPRVIVLLVLVVVPFFFFVHVDLYNPTLPGVQLPSEEESAALFETLHRNIYRAFDYTDESQVYDILARSVSESILMDLYDEVHESLTMKIEESSVSKVETVRNIETRVEIDETVSEPSYDVFATWEVIGTVKHWGHGHWRKNISRAKYKVGWIPSVGWRIVSSELIDQRRVDDGMESVK